MGQLVKLDVQYQHFMQENFELAQEEISNVITYLWKTLILSWSLLMHNVLGYQMVNRDIRNKITVKCKCQLHLKLPMVSCIII